MIVHHAKWLEEHTHPYIPLCQYKRLNILISKVSGCSLILLYVWMQDKERI